MLTTILCASLSASAYDFEVDGIYYEVISLTDLTCAVTSGYSNYKGDIIIPSEIIYNNRKFLVTDIGSKAFEDCSWLKTVNIPNSVTTIGTYAFYGCSSLQTVNIPNSVTTIENSTFSRCSSLQTVNIPNSVTTIGAYAFSRCSSLQTVNIPNSVTYIGRCVFRDCSALKDIKLSDKLRCIANGLFSGCKELTKIDIPGSIEWISQNLKSQYYPSDYSEYYTFYNCKNLTELSILYSSESLKVGYGDNDITEIGWSDWTNTITDLYLDRALEDDIPVPNLERLELGESLQKVQIKGIKNLHKLKAIVCHASVPPTLPDMSNAQYMNLEVLVPEEAIDAYRAAPNWQNFWNLKGFAGIEENIMPDTKQIVSRVSLTGYPVEENYHGIVIIRYSDGSAKKVLQ